MGLRRRREQETGENSIARSFVVSGPYHANWGDKMEDEMGRSYDTYG
jgi:hypothetical protein